MKTHRQLIRRDLCGIEAFEEAGRVLVELIDTHGPSILDRIMERNPLVSESVLETFERIGRKQLFYKLCINESPGFRALRRCPYSEQVKYFSEPLQLLLIKGKDETDTLKVQPSSLSAAQAKQVIGPKRVRTLGEQRVYLEGLRSKPQPMDKSNPYVIRHGKVVFTEVPILTEEDLLRLLLEVKRS